MAEKEKRYEGERHLIGAKIEGRVIDGRKEIMTREERALIREAVEERGVDLAVFTLERSERIKDGVKRMSRQVKELETALGGRGRLIDYCQTLLTACVASGHQAEANGFVEAYVSKHTDGSGYLHFDVKSDLLKDWLEAIMSTTHKILELSAQQDDSEAGKLQEGHEMSLCLRERVLRGWEKTGKVLVPLNLEVPRLTDKVIRTLPVGGLEKIVEYWVK